MTKLTKSERKLLQILNVLRTAFIVLGVIGFFIMLYGACAYEPDKITFIECCIHMGIGLLVLGFGFGFYQYTTNVHDDVCEEVGLYDEISFVKEAKNYDDDEYEEYMIAYTGKSPFEDDYDDDNTSHTKIIPLPTNPNYQAPSKNKPKFYDIDLKKTFGCTDKVPVSESTLNVPIIRQGVMVQETTSKTETK